jgi:hypothetical protein
MFMLVCGDKYCDIKYENCSNCPIDCGKCPLKPFHIGLMTTAGIFLLVLLIAFGSVSRIDDTYYSIYLIRSILKFKNNDFYGIQVGLSM